MKGSNLLRTNDILINWLKYISLKDQEAHMVDVAAFTRTYGELIFTDLKVPSINSFEELSPSEVVFKDERIFAAVKKAFPLVLIPSPYTGDKKAYAIMKQYTQELEALGIVKNSDEWKIRMINKNYGSLNNLIQMNLFSVSLYSGKKSSAVKAFPNFIEPFLKIRMKLSDQLSIYSNSTTSASLKFDIDSTEDKGFLVNWAAFLKYTKINMDFMFGRENISFRKFVNVVCEKEIRTFAEGIAALRNTIQDNLILENGIYDKRIGRRTHNYHASFSDELIYIDSEDKAFEWKSTLENDLLDIVKGKNELKPHMVDYLTKICEEREEIELMDEDTFWRGAFGEYPLGKGQAIVVQKKQRGEAMISVVGAPGTGKSTLFLSIIANEITNRALSLAKNNFNYNSSVMITSSTIKAVDGVIDGIKERYPERNDLYYVGGAKEKRNAATERAIKFMEELEEKEFDETEFEAKKEELLSLNNKLIKEARNYDHAQDILYRCLNEKGIHMTYSDLILIEKNTDLASVKKELTEDEKEFNKGKVEIKKLEEVLEEIVRLEKSAYRITDNIFKIEKDDADIAAIIADLYKFNQKNFISRFFSKSAMLKKVKMISSHNKYLKEISSIEKMEELSHLFKKYQRIEHKEDEVRSLIKDMEKRNTALGIKINKNKDILHKIATFETISSFNIDTALLNYSTFSEYFRNEKTKETKKMFELSDEFTQLYVLKNKKKVLWALEILTTGKKMKLSDESGFGLNDEEIKEFLKTISLVYPVFASTLMSIGKTFPFDISNIKNVPLYRTCLADEAGMIKAHEFISAGIRAESCIVVGDPKQLEPVESALSFTESLYKDLFTNSDGEFNERRYNLYSILETNAYYRAANCKFSDFEHFGTGVVLDVHRRCQPVIAEFFKEIAKYPAQLKVESVKLNKEEQKSLDVMGGKNVMFYNLTGKRIEKVNYTEIEFIAEVIKKLTLAGYDPKEDIGIITPFKEQSEKLIMRFGKELGHGEKKEKIGTVHKFQGAEYKVIIFSSVICSDADRGEFLKEPLLNVAISRAKHLFINVGDMGQLRSKTPLLEKYVSYFEKCGLVVDVK